MTTMTERRGSWGHSIRAATATERVAGTDPVAGGWVNRTCGSRCGSDIVYRVSWRVTGPDQRPRIFQRFMCPVHADRFARRHHLVLPSPVLRVDQALLPF